MYYLKYIHIHLPNTHKLHLSSHFASLSPLPLSHKCQVFLFPAFQNIFWPFSIARFLLLILLHPKLPVSQGLESFLSFHQINGTLDMRQEYTNVHMQLLMLQLLILKALSGDFPGGAVEKNHLPMQGTPIWYVVWEFHMRN